MNLNDLYKNCCLCPRSCGADRLSGKKGYCQESAQLRIASADLHFGEEKPITGKGGSGTIFISGCSLGCIFCQNHDISQGHPSFGSVISASDFSDICLKLELRGAENINIVTGSHAVPAIAEGIIKAKKSGLQLPLIWNSSAYETLEALELLKGNIDIFLPDLKTLDSSIAHNLFNASDYPQTAAAAILKMADMSDRIIIRHLILPGYMDSTRAVLQWISENVKDRATLSLMSQYYPAGKNPYAKHMPKRRLTKDEYDMSLSWLKEFGIKDALVQMW
ncbi:MAG: radical SAM protein [Treponema sp.]|nr:radical SAM protein [Treponema sp.]